MIKDTVSKHLLVIIKTCCTSQSRGVKSIIKRVKTTREALNLLRYLKISYVGIHVDKESGH